MRGAISISLLLLLTSFNLKAPNNKETTMIPDSKDPLVIRTFFKNDADWVSISARLSANYEMGFKAYVDFLSDKKYEGLNPDYLIKNGHGKYRHGFVFLADSITFSDPENTVLCLDLFDEPGKSFRVIPSELWAVENNLSIANMDFYEFYDNCDEKGVFRGFE
ncbi:hypothetical protein D3C87_13210 [compost metagenome]